MPRDTEADTTLGFGRDPLLPTAMSLPVSSVRDMGCTCKVARSSAKMAPCPACRSKTFPTRPIAILRRRACRARHQSLQEYLRRRLIEEAKGSRPWTRCSTERGAARAVRCHSQAATECTCGKTVIVVDASVLAVALGDDGADGERARVRLTDEVLAAPELVDLEAVSVWRRHVAAKLMTARRAALAVLDLENLPLQRSPASAAARTHLGVASRCESVRRRLRCTRRSSRRCIGDG